jgi:cytochrome c oxidase subunit 2
MPTYQGQVSEEGVIALVEYIKNLNSNYRIEQTLNTTDMLPEGEGKTAPKATVTAGQPVAQPAGQKAAPKGMVKQ